MCGFIVHDSRLKIPLFASNGEKSHNSLPRKILQAIPFKTYGFLKDLKKSVDAMIDKL
jgi:hypothetical protein